MFLFKIEVFNPLKGHGSYGGVRAGVHGCISHASGGGVVGVRLLDSAYIAGICFSAGEKDFGLTNNEPDRETMSGEFIYINRLKMSLVEVMKIIFLGLSALNT